MSTETEPWTPLAEAIDGKVITEDDFKAKDLERDISNEEVSADDVIWYAMQVVQENGYKLEERGRAAGNQTFHIGGADIFTGSWWMTTK